MKEVLFPSRTMRRW